MKKIIALPQNIKFKKQQKGHLTGIENKKSAAYLYYGIFGLKLLKQCRLSRKQLEATRKQISRNLRKQEKL
jgi:ribosomal protein L16/L10AE